MIRKKHKKLIKVPYIDQTKEWSTGCESVSAVMLLQYLGADISVKQFVEQYLEKEPLVVLTWQDDASYPDNMTVSDDLPAMPKNKVVFNASILHYLPEFLASYK